MSDELNERLYAMTGDVWPPERETVAALLDEIDRLRVRVAEVTKVAKPPVWGESSRAATLDATATWTGRLSSKRYHIMVEVDGDFMAACNRSFPVNEEGARAASEIDASERCMKSGCCQRWPRPLGWP